MTWPVTFVYIIIPLYFSPVFICSWSLYVECRSACKMVTIILTNICIKLHFFLSYLHHIMKCTCTRDVLVNTTGLWILYVFSICWRILLHRLPQLLLPSYGSLFDRDNKFWLLAGVSHRVRLSLYANVDIVHFFSMTLNNAFLT